MRRVLPTPSMVVAMIALMVATGTGGAVAATLITGKQIKDGSIGVRDLSPTARAALRGSAGAPGAAGAPGTPGAAGAAGTPGAAGVSGYEIVQNNGVYATGGLQTRSASCPVGKKVVGGGYSDAGGTTFPVITNRPTTNGGGWELSVDNISGFTLNVSIYAICVTVT